MSRQTTLLFAALCFHYTAANVAGQTGILEQRFRAEAPGKWKEYLELTKDIQGQMSMLSTDHQGGKVRLRDMAIYRSRGSSKLFQSSFLEPEQRHHCWVKNDRYAFELRKKGTTDSWVLSELQTDLSRWHKSRIKSYTDVNNDGKLYTPMLVFGYWLPDYLAKPGFQITKMNHAGGPHDHLIRLYFTYAASTNEKTGSNRYLEDGWVEFDPDRYWCITSFEIGEMPPSRNRNLVSEIRKFREGVKGVPLLVKATRRIKCPGESLNVDQVVEYDLDEREAAIEEFRLSAFGLPEPNGIVWETGTSRWWIWFIAAAGASLAAGGYFRHRVQRRNRALAGRVP